MGTEELWPYLLALSGVPAVLQFVTLQFFPEAPRHLYIDKGDTEGAKQGDYNNQAGLSAAYVWNWRWQKSESRWLFVVFCNPRMKALQWLWQEDNLKVELEDMQAERESARGEEAKTLRDALTSRSVRWQILTLALPCGGIQFCGINAVCSAPCRHGRQRVGYQHSLLFLRPAVFLRLWHLPRVRRAREPDATPGLGDRSDGVDGCSSLCECLLKTSKTSAKGLILHGFCCWLFSKNVAHGTPKKNPRHHWDNNSFSGTLTHTSSWRVGWLSLNISYHVSVFSNRAHWQKEADGLRLPDDGRHNVCADSHSVTQGKWSWTVAQASIWESLIPKWWPLYTAP